MGQKVNPIGIRLGIIKDHMSIWFADRKNYTNKLKIDLQIRYFLEKILKDAYISNIKIMHNQNNMVYVTIYTDNPGIIIGKQGEDIDYIRNDLMLLTGVNVFINIEEIPHPEIDAKIIAQNIANQLDRRILFRRVIKRSIQTAMRLGIKGIKIQLSGRLGGSEIARTEWQREGRVPLHTLRADIDYAQNESYTNYGVIGIKVWVFKNEIFGGIEEVRLKNNTIKVNVNGDN
ncbi:30S ribosomal protein S3 [Candidatus Johnevansia muelleri]|uniref:Small ribosomal subunit protein uS3 n=1 Tax=Candidatus Johnevansia muelleri TaxID=1495769 RepID=A0A078KDU1_9GAMM|nr:30S ribosomal protein S3 [Candidatus Evansia muelleri]